MIERIQWTGNGAADPVIRRVVSELAAGQVVALPTETVYGLAASALDPAAVERLAAAKGRDADKPMTLAIAGPEQALDWVPGMSALGRRLAQRCWPGPVTLVFQDGVADGLVSRLDEAVRRRVCPAGKLGLRVADHPVFDELLHQLPGPLVLTSANLSGEPEAITADQVCMVFPESVALVVDSGPCALGRPSTVAEVAGDRLTVLREGVVPPDELERLTCRLIVFVCTGNTCRSPLAEALCKKQLAQRLGCTPDELPQRGFLVLSAGLAAMMGDTAAPEAIAVGRELGVDLSAHASRPLTPELVRGADYLITMTQSHRAVLQARFPQASCSPRPLDPEGGDVPDPIGSNEPVYRACAQQINRFLEGLVPELQQS